MLPVHLFATLAALTPVASSYAVDSLSKRSSILDVRLSSVGNTEVKAVVKNTGSQELSLLDFNFFFDSGPIQKVTVFRDNVEVPFQGIMRLYRTTNLPQNVFTAISPGKSAEAIFDVAETTDLSAGGQYVLSSQGMVPYATRNGSSIAGAMEYISNKLEINVDGALAATVPKAVGSLDSRTNMQSCSGKKRKVVETAVRNCERLASKAAEHARSGDVAKFKEYFRTSDSKARQSVVDRLTGVARECGTFDSGKTTLHCTDKFNHCKNGALGYALKFKSILAVCPEFYEIIPDVSDQCHGRDRATTIIHEMVHTPGVYSPHCRDYAYGYINSTSLSSNLALLNAETFSLYANAVEVGC